LGGGGRGGGGGGGGGSGWETGKAKKTHPGGVRLKTNLNFAQNKAKRVIRTKGGKEDYGKSKISL